MAHAHDFPCCDRHEPHLHLPDEELHPEVGALVAFVTSRARLGEDVPTILRNALIVFGEDPAGLDEGLSPFGFEIERRAAELVTLAETMRDHGAAGSVILERLVAVFGENSSDYEPRHRAEGDWLVAADQAWLDLHRRIGRAFDEAVLGGRHVSVGEVEL